MGADLSRVLDLYAGSGALGIEALSRGAEWCDFVEREEAACNLIRDNLRETGFSHQAGVHRMPVERLPDGLVGPYTVVLADPPYAEREAFQVLGRLAASPLVEEGATILAVEHSARWEPPPRLGRLSLVNTRRHGDSVLSIYR